jgi:hypothetical protein
MSGVRRRIGIGLVGLALLSASTVQIGLGAALTVTAAHLLGANHTYAAPVTCTLSAVSDSYVNSALATTNFGTSTLLSISPNTLSTQRAFVRFDLTTCSPAIPADALVRSATLSMTVAAAVLATRTIDLRSATASWTEAGVTWNAQPTVAGSVTSSAGVTVGQAVGTVISWNAVADVQSFVTAASTDFGFRLSDSAEGVIGGLVLSFNAREAASGRPQLVVTYIS